MIRRLALPVSSVAVAFGGLRYTSTSDCTTVECASGPYQQTMWPDLFGHTCCSDPRFADVAADLALIATVSLVLWMSVRLLIRAFKPRAASSTPTGST